MANDLARNEYSSVLVFLLLRSLNTKVFTFIKQYLGMVDVWLDANITHPYS